MSANLLIIIVAVGFLVLLGLAVRDFIRTIFFNKREHSLTKIRNIVSQRRCVGRFRISSFDVK